MDKTWMPLVAGILSIVAGGLSLIGGIIAILAASVFMVAPYSGLGQEAIGIVFFLAVLIPFLIICAVAIIGGIYAIKRRNWGLALAGAICSILTSWAWMLGVAAVVLVALSKKEFNGNSSILPPPPPPQQQY